MSMTIKIDGLDRLVAAMAAMPDVVHQEMRKEMHTQLAAIDEVSKTTHFYTTRSANLERSNDIVVDADGMTGTIFLSKTKAKAPYAWRIHEGFVGMTDSKGRHFNGPAADQFLYKAGDLRRVAMRDGMEDAIGRAITKAGF
jgi:hypothetical protein